MNNWQETAEIVARLRELAAEGRAAALATVVTIEGSAYRRPGAKLLVPAEGPTRGGVSGGCLEADVRELALGVLAAGGPVLKRYDTGATDEEIAWGLGLGCNGKVEVFVQEATRGALAELLPRLAGLLAGDEAFALVTRLAKADGTGGRDAAAALLVTGAGSLGSLGTAELDRRARAELGAAAATGRSGVRSIGDVDLFFDLLAPPPHLLVFGAGDDAQALTAAAAEAGFRVAVVDHRPALATAERFPRATRVALARPEDPTLALPDPTRALAVVKMHAYSHDRDWARRLLAAGVPFVGLLGPRARSAKIREEIGAAGDGRLVGPVGLDLGAEGSRQIAVSIVAQLLAFLAGREPRPLAERSQPIHAG